MLRRGYTDAGLDELLGRARLPKGSFYNLFPSKEAFGVEVVERFYARHQELLRWLLAETETPARERLDHYAEWVLSWDESAPLEERGCLLAIVALEKSGTSEPLRAALARDFERWRVLLGELLEQVRSEGGLNGDDDPERLAGLLIDGLEGALLRARLERSSRPARDFLELGLPRLLGS